MSKRCSICGAVHSKAALQIADVVMNGKTYLFTAYGRKRVCGIADMIDRAVAEDGEADFTEAPVEKPVEAKQQVVKKRLQSRDKLVRDLTQSECRGLLVHSHLISETRRKAILLRTGRPTSLYFTDAQVAVLKAWIDREDYLKQDDRTADHPKLPTTWCDHCGQVNHCKHVRVEVVS